MNLRWFVRLMAEIMSRTFHIYMYAKIYTFGPTYVNRRGYSAGNYKGHLNRCLEVEGLRKATLEHRRPISRTCFACCSAVLTLCPSSVGKRYPALLREQGSAIVQSAQQLAQRGCLESPFPMVAAGFPHTEVVHLT